MPTSATPMRNRLKVVICSRYFWIVAVMLAATTILHYFTPQVRFLPLTSFPLTRHTAERVLFLLPVAGAAFAFGKVGGIFTLAIVILIMLPRVFWVSPQPMDAFAETVGIAVVGYLVLWIIEVQEKAKESRESAVARLQAIRAISTVVTESLELQRIMRDALDTVLAVMGLDAGLIFLSDRQSGELRLSAFQGISTESAMDLDRLKLGEGFCGRVAQSGEPMTVDDSIVDPRLTRLGVRREELRGQVVVPLKSKREVQGVLAVASRELRQFPPEDVELIVAIGNQIGVAIENARLYENMRFYIREITNGQEAERKRIARELHDDTIQSLVHLSRRLDEVAGYHRDESPKAAAETLEDLHGLVDSVLQNLRGFIRTLRPPVLDDLGLLRALEGLMAEVEADGIQAELEVCGSRRRLPPDAELAMFRIVQEALNNVRRHSRASKVVTTVHIGESRMTIAVKDNGHGFDPPGDAGDLAVAGKLGLIGMHERARLLGGELRIEAEPGRGVTVIVDVPVHPWLEGADG